MAEQPGFQQGDIVIHPKRPEWGDGTILKAIRVTYNGKSGQRLTVEFKNHGRITINTAVAQLISKDAITDMNGSTPGQGWLTQLENETGSADTLYALPEALTDPFASLVSRLTHTLDTYRFSINDPRALFDWAVIQTGLNDPMTQYTRHELEQAFPRFARDRDKHLAELAKLIKTKNQLDVFKQALKETRAPAAKAALEKAMRG